VPNPHHSIVYRPIARIDDRRIRHRDPLAVEPDLIMPGAVRFPIRIIQLMTVGNLAARLPD
jgi:hypothetical protein